MSITIFGITVAGPLIVHGLRMAAYEIQNALRERERRIENEKKEKSQKNVQKTNSATVSPKQISIAVLGMPSAGKTTLHCSLQKKEYTGGLQTLIDQYSSYSIKKSNGTTISIREGIDIGGASNFVFRYKELINKSEKILFLFDIKKYEESKSYRGETNSRLQHVVELIRDSKKQLSFMTLLTHKDEMPSYDDLQSAFTKFRTEISSKNYSEIVLKYQCATIDLTNKKEIQQLIDRFL